jgi:CRP-like cAMP-binding protein
MTIESDIAFLEQVPTLRRLGAPALRILAIGAESYTLEPGQLLFAAGEPADCAYVVQEGSFGLAPQSPGEAEVIAGPATMLGESALLVDTRRPTSATAREDSTVLRISRAMFLKMLESYPDAAHRLRELLAARADQWAHDVESVSAALTRGTGPR